MKSRTALTALLVLIFAGCSTQRQAAPPPLMGEPKRTGLARVFTMRAEPAGYGWDGQMSSMAVKQPVNVVFGRSTEVLHRLGFTIRTEETRRERNSGRITGTKPDKTVVLVLLEEKTPGATEVRAKVGALGERTGSERVLDDLQRSLEKAPAAREAGETGR